MVPEVTYRCCPSSVEILQPRLRFGLQGTVLKNLGIGFSLLFLTAFVTCASASSGHMEGVSVSPDGKVLAVMYEYEDEHAAFINICDATLDRALPVCRKS